MPVLGAHGGESSCAAKTSDFVGDEENSNPDPKMTEDCNVYLQSFRSAASRERKESSSDESFISVVRDPEATIMDTPEGVLRVHKECRQLNFLYRFYHVPSDYYSWELAQRA